MCKQHYRSTHKMLNSKKEKRKTGPNHLKFKQNPTNKNTDRDLYMGKIKLATRKTRIKRSGH